MSVCSDTVWMNAFHDGEDRRVRILLGGMVSLRHLPRGCLGSWGRWGLKMAEVLGKFFNIDVETLLPRWVGIRGR